MTKSKGIRNKKSSQKKDAVSQQALEQRVQYEKKI